MQSTNIVGEARNEEIAAIGHVSRIVNDLVVHCGNANGRVVKVAGGVKLKHKGRSQ